MSMLPISPRVNLEQSRKQAKDLLKAFKSADPEALDSIRWHHPRMRGLSDAQIHASRFTLADAQLVIARLHHFDSWSKLLQYIENLRTSDPGVTRFEAAADAIVAGDIETLRGLLREHPQLVRERSSRAHHAPLLHYTTANGVENYRQISPANAVETAELLLDAGAAVDATSEAYGGGSTALLLVATSTPPRRARVQLPLIDLLLEHGAAIDGVWSRGSTVTAALANNCGEAARRLAERGASVPGIIEAAGLGGLDLVQKFAAAASGEQLEKALVMAARHGSHAVVEFLLNAGVDSGASDGMTALHEAAGRGDLGMMELLIQHGAPLEKKNGYGGTVLDGVLWFARNTDPADAAQRNYPAVIDLLIAAGARTDVYPEMQECVKQMLS